MDWLEERGTGKVLWLVNYVYLRLTRHRDLRFALNLVYIKKMWLVKTTSPKLRISIYPLTPYTRTVF
jgi:hypothetical protein